MRRALPLALVLLAACAAQGSRPGEVIRFQTEDGVELVGEARGRGPHGVVLAHMFGSSREAWADFATIAADEGFRTLAFDFRGFGESAGSPDALAAPRDLAAALEALRDQGAADITVIGASFGGTATLQLAAGTSLAGVATLSAPADFEGLTAPREVVEAVDEPKLFIAAQDDTPAADAAQGFYQVASGAKRVEIVTGDDHGTALLEGRQGEQVRRLLLGFLEGQTG